MKHKESFGFLFVMIFLITITSVINYYDDYNKKKAYEAYQQTLNSEDWNQVKKYMWCTYKTPDHTFYIFKIKQYDDALLKYQYHPL